MTKWIWATFLVFLPITGYSIAQFTDWVKGLHPEFWAAYLLILPAVWFSARAAAAAERLRGPFIADGDLRYDDRHKVFDVQVQNIGSGEVTARIFAIGTTQSWRIGSGGIEIHWRGLHDGKPMLLAGHNTGIAGILQVWETEKGPVICLIPVSGREEDSQKAQLCDPAPLDQQRELFLVIRIAFFIDGALVKDKTRRFSIRPTPNGAQFYEVLSVKPNHYPGRASGKMTG
jgi:hypothetical protein